jgi:hypothetical protein
MRERKSFLLRMDPALYAALEAWAEQEMRSLTGQIEYLLKEAVARRSHSRPPSAQAPQTKAGNALEMRFTEGARPEPPQGGRFEPHP